MELRVLRYFLAVAREESISSAADFLHITQPTLSRQLMDLEKELGKQLLIRGKRNRKITLTEDGMRLRKRAEEIIELTDKTEAEFLADDHSISGDVCIGCGESDAIHIIAKTAVKLRHTYPDIRFHLYSGNAEDVSERMEKGLLDFGIFISADEDIDKYDYLKLPAYDTWGLIIPKTGPLAAKEYITPHDLEGLPLIISRQAINHELTIWGKEHLAKFNIAGTYNLVFNAAIMVEEGFGYAMTLDKLVDTGASSRLCFRPLKPELKVNLSIAWKKYQIFSKAAQKFLEYLKKEIAE